MKDFLLETYIDIFTDDWMGIVIGILIWIVSLIVVGLVAWGILYLIDSVALPVKEGKGTIIGKIYEPAHTTTTLVYNAATKTSIPHVVHYFDAWKLIIEFDEKEDDFYLDADEYVRYEINQKIPIHYSIGRIWGNLYVKSVL